MKFLDIEKMGLQQLLVYEADLRDVQAQAIRDMIFDGMGKPPARKAMTDAEREAIRAGLRATEVDDMNRKPLTKAQIENMNADVKMTLADISAGRLEEVRPLVDRWRRTLPRQVEARGDLCFSVFEMRRVIDAWDAARDR